MTFTIDHWQRRLDDLAREHDVPGAVLGVLVGDEVHAAASGVLNRATGVATTTDSLFQIGSITKVYTATVVMRLAEQGRIDIDRPVRELLPEFRVSDPETTQALTPRHLLCHTGGIGGDLVADCGRGDDVLERFVAACADATQDVPFGTAMSYSNAGYSILGRLIERGTGQVWDHALRDLLLDPAGLTHTVTLPEDALRFRTAIGHVPGPDGDWQPSPVWGLPRFGGPAAGCCSDVADVLAFARLHLNGGLAADGSRVLAAETVQEMLSPQVTPADPWMAGSHWGLGWILNGRGGRRLFGHDGDTIGQKAYLQVLPDRGVAVVVLTNGGRSGTLAATLQDELLAVLGDVPASLWPQPVGDGRGAADDVIGVYERMGVRVTVTDTGGELTGTSELLEPLRSLMPDRAVTRFPVRASDRGPGVYVAHMEPDEERWSPLVLFEINGVRYIHLGVRAARKVG
ncbi:serine hydrolase domain-containing protein [Nonomuraea sp. NPDC046570]|uniref:serine hydrolase domain-containing protein n=1 Tax=Nonomuraea sp. NPDC046570 TaxID=3155255 RepID=UPI0033FA28EB